MAQRASSPAALAGSARERNATSPPEEVIPVERLREVLDAFRPLAGRGPEVCPRGRYTLRPRGTPRRTSHRRGRCPPSPSRSAPFRASKCLSRALLSAASLHGTGRADRRRVHRWRPGAAGSRPGRSEDGTTGAVDDATKVGPPTHEQDGIRAASDGRAVLPSA